MEYGIAILLGLLCGAGQFLILRLSLRPLAEGNTPRMLLGFLLRLPLPLGLLGGYAWLATDLLPFAGGAFCLSLTLGTVANHIITSKGSG